MDLLLIALMIILVLYGFSFVRWIVVSIKTPDATPQARFWAWRHGMRYPAHLFVRTSHKGVLIGAACIKCHIVYFGDSFFRATVRQITDNR